MMTLKERQERMSSKPMNAIGYVRVSTQAQAGDDRYGIDVQRRAILDYADTHGYVIRKWFVDEMSGAKEDRPEWNKIVRGDECFNPPYSAVIVFKNDRVARDTKLYFYFLMLLEKKNVKLLSTQEDFLEGNEFANIYRSLMMFVAEQERKNITLRTSSGRVAKASKGGYSGGQPPYGYYNDNGELKVEEQEAKMVRLIFRLLDLGCTFQYVCDYINAAGFRKRNGTIFTPASILPIKNNRPLYEGMYKYGKMEHYIPGVHEPILDTVYDPAGVTHIKRKDNEALKEKVERESREYVLEHGIVDGTMRVY